MDIGNEQQRQGKSQVTNTNIYFPRFAKDGTDRAQRILSDERIAGKRAPYHVYYRKSGKPKVDAAYRDTPQEAIEFIRKAVRGAEILGVVSTVPMEL
jgi:hypothetical protein